MKMKKKILSFLLAAAVVLGAVIPASLAYAQSGNTAAPLQATDEDGNGLYVGKTAATNDDGSYTITMEAYTTGSVTSVESAVPLDIVLVLDQSGSMADDFGNTTRQAAMKQAVVNFIDSVAEQYNAETADHRMAIVTFGDSASTKKGWTYVNQQGEQTLKGVVNDLPNSPSGATRVDFGMSSAETLMGSGHNYTGDNTTRQKVVIVFTDGVPTTSSDFSVDVANNAIKFALNLKNAGVTVYSVGIFDGANPDELYGASGFDTNSDGSVGSEWISDNWELLPGLRDFPEVDIPAGNRFLNYLSNNFMDASAIGLNRTESGLGILHKKFTYEVTQNFTRTDTGYYLTASDQEGLNDVFQTISDEISTPSIQLGPETEIRDVVAPYFNAPTDPSEIKVFTAAYDGSNFGARTEETDVNVTVNNGVVSVTGFNFNENFVSEDPREGDFYGKKLIIEFTVTAKDGFLGGNSVPTNGADSGVYGEDNFFEAFPQPTVDVPIGEVKIAPKDKNLYLMGDLTADEAKKDATVTVGGVEVNLDPSAENYGLQSWQNEFVNFTVSNPNITGVTDDRTYDLGMEVAPKYEGTVKAQNGNGTANIYVFKPEITWKDSQLNVGETADYQKQNFAGVEWKHDTVAYDEDKMVGKAPELVYEYAPQANAFTQETKVNVTVKIGGSDVTQYVTFAHKDCTFDGCQFDPDECEFIVHIKSFDLTITKTGCKAIDENQSFVFTVTGSNGFTMQVVINGNGSKTIKGLPSGTYTVTEDTNWSWRYEPDEVSKTVTTANIQNGKATVNFANDRAEESDGTGTDWKWLNGSAYTENKFGIPPQ